MLEHMAGGGRGIPHWLLWLLQYLGSDWAILDILLAWKGVRSLSVANIFIE